MIYPVKKDNNFSLEDVDEKSDWISDKDTRRLI